MIRCIAVMAVAGFAVAAQGNRSLLLTPDSPEFTKPAPAVCRITLDTTKGPVVIDVTRAWSPLGADRFVNLVRLGYYDDNRLFRINPGRWAQWGINGDPDVAKAWRQKTFADDPFTQSNVRGTVAFAFAVKNGRTTQVFINLQDNSATHDTEPFTPFGRVIEGMDIVDKWNSEYGDNAIGGIRAGHQDPFFNGGNAYMDATFPRMDKIRTATIQK